MGKSTISMAIVNSFLYVYQRVLGCLGMEHVALRLCQNAEVSSDVRINGRGLRSARSMGFREAEVTFPPTYKYIPGGPHNNDFFDIFWLGIDRRINSSSEIEFFLHSYSLRLISPI